MVMPTTMPNFYLLKAFQAEICKHHDTKTYLACTIQLSININMDSYIHTYMHIKPNTYTYMIYIVATPLDDDRDREVQEYLLAARKISIADFLSYQSQLMTILNKEHPQAVK